MKIKILKVKPWMIKFSVDEQKFFLKNCEDGYETVVCLFKFDCDEKGKYKVEYLGGHLGSISLHRAGYNYKRGSTYKQFNVAQFLYYLASLDFATHIGVSKEWQEYFKTCEKRTMLIKKLGQLEEEVGKCKDMIHKCNELLIANDPYL